MRSIRLVLALALISSAGVVWWAGAQPATPPPMVNPVGPSALATDGGDPLPPGAPVDQVLDALHDRGQSLKEFVTDVELTETDVVMSSESKRVGRAWYQVKPNGDARLHIRFDKRVVGERPPLAEVKEYLLDDGWLTDRDYRSKVETRRQVARQGEKVNLFQLGKGPFPLPIGQDKKDVHELFDVTKLPPANDDPDTVVNKA